MVRRLGLTVMATLAATSLGLAQSPNGVKTLDPPGAIKAEGTWSLGARAGDFVFVAGMQGVDPATNKLVADPQGRISQAFLNIKLIAQSEGASLQDCVRVTVYVSDLNPTSSFLDAQIRRIAIATGTLTTIADRTGVSIHFDGLYGVASDRAGGLYVDTAHAEAVLVSRYKAGSGATAYR